MSRRLQVLKTDKALKDDVDSSELLKQLASSAVQYGVVESVFYQEDVPGSDKAMCHVQFQRISSANAMLQDLKQSIAKPGSVLQAQLGPSPSPCRPKTLLLHGACLLSPHIQEEIQGRLLAIARSRDGNISRDSIVLELKRSPKSDHLRAASRSGSDGSLLRQAEIAFDRFDKGSPLCVVNVPSNAIAMAIVNEGQKLLQQEFDVFVELLLGLDEEDHGSLAVCYNQRMINLIDIGTVKVGCLLRAVILRRSSAWIEADAGLSLGVAASPGVYEKLKPQPVFVSLSSAESSNAAQVLGESAISSKHSGTTGAEEGHIVVLKVTQISATADDKGTKIVTQVKENISLKGKNGSEDSSSPRALLAAAAGSKPGSSAPAPTGALAAKLFRALHSKNAGESSSSSGSAADGIKAFLNPMYHTLAPLPPPLSFRSVLPSCVVSGIDPEVGVLCRFPLWEQVPSLASVTIIIPPLLVTAPKGGRIVDEWRATFRVGEKINVMCLVGISKKSTTPGYVNPCRAVVASSLSANIASALSTSYTLEDFKSGATQTRTNQTGTDAKRVRRVAVDAAVWEASSPSAALPVLQAEVLLQSPLELPVVKTSASRTGMSALGTCILRPKGFISSTVDTSVPEVQLLKKVVDDASRNTLLFAGIPSGKPGQFEVGSAVKVYCTGLIQTLDFDDDEEDQSVQDRGWAAVVCSLTAPVAPEAPKAAMTEAMSDHPATTGEEDDEVTALMKRIEAEQAALVGRKRPRED